MHYQSQKGWTGPEHEDLGDQGDDEPRIYEMHELFDDAPVTSKRDLIEFEDQDY